MAGLELTLQGLALGIVGDHADLGQPAGKRGRRANQRAQQGYAVGQSLAARISRQGVPVNRRALVGRCAQVVAEGRAQGDLVARLDLQRVDDRRPDIGLVTFQDLGQCIDLGLTPVEHPGGLLMAAARRALGLARRAVILGRAVQGRARAGQGLFRLAQPGTRLGERPVVGLRGLQAGTLLADLGDLGAQALDSLGQLTDLALQAVAPGLVRRQAGELLGERGLGRGALGFGRFQRVRGSGPLALILSFGRAQGLLLGGQAGKRAARILDLLLGARPVAVDLGQMLAGAALGGR